MKRTLVHMTTLVFAAAVAGLGVASVTVGTATAGEIGSAVQSSINYYETPCQTAARVQYGVPLHNAAHAQWQVDHAGTPEGKAYNRAALACAQPAKFDFAHMILVGSE